MKKFLSLGEQLRENPKTIWLSIPVLILGIMWYGIKGDKEGQTGGYGHLGLTFRLLHKHQGQSKLFLRISYWLFSQANHIGVGSGLPTVRLKMAQVVAQLGDLKQAKMDIESAIKLCQQTKDISQAAYITAHLGRIKIKLGDLAGAKRDLESSFRDLEKILKKRSTMHHQIWMSTAEMGLSEWYFASGDKKQALLWAQKAAARAQKQDLKTRMLDISNLIHEIEHG